MIKTLLIIAASMLMTLPAMADESKMTFDTNSVPFKSCVGRGNSPMSLYAGQTVNVIFGLNSIQVVDSSGKKDV